MASWLRRAMWRRRYRAGAIVSQFVARDVRRDVEVIDTAELDDGFIVARVRTWNVLYAVNRIVPEPPYGAPERRALATLWEWTGAPWGGPVDQR